MNEPEVLVVDHSGSQKIQEWRYASLDNMSLRDANRETQIPEEWMAKLSDCLGDAQAQVTVSADLGSNNYGTKAGSFVSVKVTCGNNERDINEALNIARTIAESKVKENFSRMEEVLADALKPAESKVPTKALGQSPPPAAPKKPLTTKPAAGQPDFRR